MFNDTEIRIHKEWILIRSDVKILNVLLKYFKKCFDEYGRA